MNSNSTCTAPIESVSVNFDLYGGLAIAIITLVVTILWIAYAYRKGLI